MKKSKIVIVDDVQLQRELTCKILKKEGFETVALSSGEEAIHYFRDHTADLVLLDIMMDGVSGIGVLKHLRQKFQSIELPIIMVTSKNSDNDIVEAFEEGANDFIMKPVSWSIALARIEMQLNLCQFHVESLRLKELQALNALIVTYNHEINGALSILTIDVKDIAKKDKKYKRSVEAAEKINSILKKIEKITTEKVEYCDYSDKHQMIAIKK